MLQIMQWLPTALEAMNIIYFSTSQAVIKWERTRKSQELEVMKDIVIYYVIFILAGLTILGEEEKYKFNEPIFIVLGTYLLMISKLLAFWEISKLLMGLPSLPDCEYIGVALYYIYFVWLYVYSYCLSLVEF